MEPYVACHSSRPHRERAVSTPCPVYSGLAVNQDEVAINAPLLYVRASVNPLDLKSEGRKAVTIHRDKGLTLWVAFRPGPSPVV